MLFLIMNLNCEVKPILQMTLENMISFEEEGVQKNLFLDFLSNFDGASVLTQIRKLVKERYRTTNVFIDELHLPALSDHPKIAAELQDWVKELKVQGGSLWLALAGFLDISDDIAKVYEKEHLQELFKDFFLPRLQIPLRSTKLLVKEAVGERNRSSVMVTGQLSSNIDLSLPDNMTEGLQPDVFEVAWDEAGIKEGVRQAMQLVQDR